MGDKFLNILKEEMVLAEGCTEPIAIAYACAIAKSYLKGEPTKIKLELSCNMIKNVDGVVIPNSGGRVGVPPCAILGTYFGDHTKNLLVISDVTKDQIDQIGSLLNKGIVEVKVSDLAIKLYIKATLYSNEENVEVEIKHVHTNVTRISVNGSDVLNIPCNDGDFNSPLSSRQHLTIEKIVEYANTVELSGELKDLLITMEEKNLRIAEEGFSQRYGLNVGTVIRDNIKKGFLAADIRNMPSSLAASGSDARMSGCSLPVMSVAGSGNQGMTISLSIYEFAKMIDATEELRLRAQIVGLLSTIHIKTNVGRLSAYCGVVCAAAGAGAGITYLQGGGYPEISSSIIITLSNLSGMLCDGAKNTCALKICSGITSAVDSSLVAMNRMVVGNVGIANLDVENTIRNVGLIANEALHSADKCILEIMTNRR